MNRFYSILSAVFLMTFLAMPVSAVCTGPGLCSVFTDEIDCETGFVDGGQNCDWATDSGSGETDSGGGQTDSGSGATDSGGGTNVIGGGKQELINPLTGTEGNVPFTTIINNVITALAGLAAVFALLGFVWGGVTWITAYGSEQKITRGKQMLTWSFIGLIVVFGSYGFVRFIIESLIGQQ